ncbi:hypothetical protein Ccrd_003327 [Cynara cardunculus var. scolymus]|uniref:Uncharacterized protein n=1 Tax=Cynara cardunculus var. scolymus TaxID=59895 RepID=A0A124SCR3_CYNCS|nr:hypothetical protein Ccrd_003327 [Cynara cardunculus var. scolymus]
METVMETVEATTGHHGEGTTSIYALFIVEGASVSLRGRHFHGYPRLRSISSPVIALRRNQRYITKRTSLVKCAMDASFGDAIDESSRLLLLYSCEASMVLIQKFYESKNPKIDVKKKDEGIDPNHSRYVHCCHYREPANNGVSEWRLPDIFIFFIQVDVVASLLQQIVRRSIVGSSIQGKICMGTGLSYDTNEPVLKDAFGQHGEIIEVNPKERACHKLLQLKLYVITRVANQKGMDLYISFLRTLPAKPWQKWTISCWMVEIFGSNMQTKNEPQNARSDLLNQILLLFCRGHYLDEHACVGFCKIDK